MSGSGMPELGSKISLISKADIRYEGRLFTVDPQECTIALANVRSFGTEDRETPYPIMPQPTVYDYILFRGSDIKDIRVVNNMPMAQDPAIMQMHSQGQQNFPPQNFPPMQPGAGAPQMNSFAPFGQMQGQSLGAVLAQQAQASPIHQPQQQLPPQAQQQAGNLAPGSGPGQKKKSNSRSGTPQNVARKSPVADMSSQTNQAQRDNQSGNKDKQHPNQRNQRNNQQQQQQQQRERRDSGRNEMQENKGGYRNQNQNQRPMNNQQRGYNNRGPNMGNQRGGNQQQGGSARMRGGPMQNNYRQQNNNQGVHNQNKPMNGPNQQHRGSKGNALKFENEFDFEQANVKFEEVRAQLGRLKVGNEESKPSDQVNGEIEKKDDSGNETAADHEVETDENCYDKNKSFFDNISCEAVERAKGKAQRVDWRQERKINSETFGYTSINRRPRYYQKRGGNYQNSYNRGPRQGGYGQGQNYRPVRNHRNQNNVEGRSNAQNNAQGTNQQSQSQPAPVAAN